MLPARWLWAALVAGAVAVPAQAQPAEGVTIEPPRVLEQTHPEYPTSRDGERTSGTVLLTVTVGEDGAPTKIEVDRTLGEAFDRAAIAAVRTWRFEPARVDGAPRAARITVEVAFTPPPLPAPSDVGAEPARPEVEPPPVPPTTPASSRAAALPAEATELTVHGRVRAPSRGASDLSIHIGALARVPRQDATELLELAPGILLTNEAGDGHPEQVFLRGFDARLGQDIEFSLDGVPINQVGNLEGNGFADLNFVIPELVDELRVVEGPFDPRQGSFAVAGSADYHLGLERRGLTAKSVLGSFGSRRLVLTWGAADASIPTLAGAELAETDGFGQNRAATSAKAMAQAEGQLEAWTWRLTGTAYATAFESAGVLREDDYRTGRQEFFDTYDTWQGGAAERFSLAADVGSRSERHASGLSAYAIRSGVRMRENFTGYLLDVQEQLQTPHAQRGDRLERTYDGLTTGTRAFGRWTPEAFGRRHGLELGLAARGDFVDAQQFRVQASNGVPYSRELDLGARVANLALYVDGDLRVLEWLTLRGGLRGESFFYDLEDRCAATSVRFPAVGFVNDSSCPAQQPLGDYRDPTQRSGASGMTLLPRGSVLFGPFEGFQLSLAYGRGARAIDPQFVNDQTRTPFSTLTAYEGGVTYARSFERLEVVARSVFFRTEIGQDLIFSQTEGRNTLATGTARTGWMGALRATGRWFDSNSNLTLVSATFADTKLLVPYIPALVLRSDDAVHHELSNDVGSAPLDGALALGLTYVAPRPLPYDQRGESIFTCDGSATLAWRGVETGLLVTNLFDRRYRLGEYNYESDFRSRPAATLVPHRHFAAGPPRAFYWTLAITLGDTE